MGRTYSCTVWHGVGCSMAQHGATWDGMSRSAWGVLMRLALETSVHALPQDMA